MRQNSLLFGLVIGAMSLTTVSCVDSSFLNETQTSDLSKEAIFSDSTYTVGFLNHIYADAGYDIYPNRFDGGIWRPGEGGLQTACDEAEFKVTSNVTDGVMFATGTVNPVTISDEPWSKCYKQIRSANVFLANVDNSPMNSRAKTLYRAEARFMRAWYYFMLLRHYGGVPLLGDVVYENDDVDNVNMTRASFADCVQYIVDECNAAAADLPNRRSGTSFGRASAGACMGLISRVLLYAASPLYNGEGITDDPRLKPLLGYADARPERWKDAADAAMRLIRTGSWQVYNRHQDKDGNNEPGWGFYAQFQAYDFTSLNSYNGQNYTSGAYCGHIFTWKRAMGNEREGLWYPVTCGGNGNGGYPTLELMESFPMKDGAAPGKGKYEYSRMNPAKDRDPRFANCFVWNGTECAAGGGNKNMVYTYQGVGSSSDAIYQGTRTGNYFRKMCHRDCAGNHFVTVEQSYCLIRYEEILLNYAEAVNEYYGPDHAEVIGNVTVSPIDALKMIRERAGIEAGDDGMYGLQQGMDKDAMREAIRLERRVELALEGHRFFDVRRWKIADKTENAVTHGFEITRKLDGTESGREVAVRQHVFRPAMYFWPIPYKEVTRSEELLQNPYYE
jgi:hypothetical protein